MSFDNLNENLCTFVLSLKLLKVEGKKQQQLQQMKFLFSLL